MVDKNIIEISMYIKLTSSGKEKEISIDAINKLINLEAFKKRKIGDKTRIGTYEGPNEWIHRSKFHIHRNEVQQVIIRFYKMFYKKKNEVSLLQKEGWILKTEIVFSSYIENVKQILIEKEVLMICQKLKMPIWIYYYLSDEYTTEEEYLEDYKLDTKTQISSELLIKSKKKLVEEQKIEEEKCSFTINSSKLTGVRSPSLLTRYVTGGITTKYKNAVMRVIKKYELTVISGICKIMIFVVRSDMPCVELSVATLKFLVRNNISFIIELDGENNSMISSRKKRNNNMDR